MKDTDIPKVEYRKGIYYLVLDGKTPYDRGYQHGVALEFPIKKALRQFKKWIRVNIDIEDPEAMLEDFAMDSPYIESVKNDVPDLFEEMEGIAKGAGVNFNQLFIYQSLDEFYMYLMQSGALDSKDTTHCTTAGVYARPDKPNFVGHNNDLPSYHEELVTVLQIKYPTSDLQILQGTFAGQIGQNGLNNHGVAVGCNLIGNLPSGDGVPLSINIRKILECSNVDEAVAYLKRSKFAQSMNYMIGDREKIVSVETWQNNATVLDIYDNNFTIHTNHTLQQDAPKTFEMSAETGGGSISLTVERLNVAQKILSNNTSNIRLEEFKRIFMTRPILVYPGKPSGRTIMNMVAEIPKTGNPVLYLTPDSPNIFKHAKFTFS
jgi:predicted choloylglycine hydrolase